MSDRLGPPYVVGAKKNERWYRANRGRRPGEEQNYVRLTLARCPAMINGERVQTMHCRYEWVPNLEQATVFEQINDAAWWCGIVTQRSAIRGWVYSTKWFDQFKKEKANE